MVQVSQENDKKSIFVEHYFSETVLDLRDNVVPTPKHLYGGRELPIKKSEFWILFVTIFLFHFELKDKWK